MAVLGASAGGAAAAEVSSGAAEGQAAGPAFFYQPAEGVLADVIPFFWKGKFHLLYLQLKPGQKGFDWAQIVSDDFASCQYTGVAIAGGESDDAVDRDIFTGSVIAREDTLYAFYTGHNQALTPDHVLLRAVSRDGFHWTKEPQFRLTPQGQASYVFPGACRDPFVFWNPERNEYGMLFTATPVRTPIGGLAYASSRDLQHWRLEEPLSASGRFPGYECPDLFPAGERWYLLFSTYARNPGWATRYMTAPRLEGPWASPADDFLDGGALYAAKSVSDGKRRFLCGTLPSRKGQRDDGENGWGGRLVVYELRASDEGTLRVRIPAEVERSFGESQPRPLVGNQDWEKDGEGWRCVVGQAMLYIDKLPLRCLLTAQLTLPPTGRAGLWLGGDAQNEKAFRVYLDVGSQRLVVDRGPLPLGSNPEMERPYRPLKIRPGDQVVLKVALDGDAAVICVNDSICLATRIYERRENTCGVWSDTAGTAVRDVQLRRPTP